jgi:hypothetical protein
MSETVKKTKTPAKPRKTAAKKDNVLTMTGAPQSKGSQSNGSQSFSAGKSFSHDEVAKLAHRFWAERGCQDGHDEEDWLRAEQELRGRAS